MSRNSTIRYSKYKNLAFLILGIVAAYLISRSGLFNDLVIKLQYLGYFGSFVGGALFIFTFTFAIGSLILAKLGEGLNPLLVSFFAAWGAAAGDYLIFRFIKNDLEKETGVLHEYLSDGYLSRILNTRYFKWTLPVIGAIIIASPLPDELGVSLMGISKMKTSSFLLLSFFLNFAGIFLVVSAIRFFT